MTRLSRPVVCSHMLTGSRMGRRVMVARLVTTITVLAFAIGAFFGAGPTEAGPFNSFGLSFLGVAGLVWFAWKPMSRGFDQPGTIDGIAKGWLGLDHGRRRSASH